MEQKPKGKRTWWRKRHVVLGLSIVTGLIMVILVQLLYPAGKALPIAHIGASSVGGQTFQQAIETIRYDYASVPLTVEIPNKPPYKTTSSEAGIVPAYRHAAEAVTDYSLRARLVPFSFIYKMLQRPAVGYEIDEMNFETFATKLSAYCVVAPKDAALVFSGGGVKLDQAKAGQSCDESSIRSVLTDATLKPGGTSIKLTPKVDKPRVDDAELRTQLAAAEATIKAGLTVRAPEDTWQVPSETVANWLTTEEKDGRITLAVKRDAVKTYLDGLRGELYIEPGTTRVGYLDGIEVSRVTGSRGQGVDLDVSTNRVEAVLLGTSATDRTAWLQLTVLEPRVVADRSYSATNQGLQALLVQWDRDHSAGYGLMVRDISGKGMNADFNPDRDFVTASTFKMFLAYAVLHKVETGELSMDSQTDMGLSVRACIDEMILHSTNACALSLFNLAGWGYVHDFILGQFPSTRLMNSANSDNEKHTTVRDETNFLIKLNAGQLMNAQNTSYLLDLMKRQIYRSGIPKGVPGITVADKVGFYNGYKHDVGIVYAPRGTYILSYLSIGGNDAEIAELSRQVYSLMSR